MPEPDSEAALRDRDVSDEAKEGDPTTTSWHQEIASDTHSDAYDVFAEELDLAKEPRSLT